MDKWIDAYDKLNSSFSKKMVFRLGADAGFFSEFNNMILGMIFCLSRNINFSLYSKSNKYSSNDSWQDFFCDFCKVNNDSINEVINLRPYQINKNIDYILRYYVYKFSNNIDYLTQDFWPIFHDDITGFSKELFNIPQLGIANINILEVSRILIKNIWVYNDRSAVYIEKMKSLLRIPDNYASMHIRSGDKYIETGLRGVEDYMRLLPKDIKDVFVLTDDYSVIEEIERKYPSHRFFTLCEPLERGYFHKEFLALGDEEKYKRHLKLFASLDICSLSELFIGTYSSNPGMYMGMRIGKDKCIGVDSENWSIW